LSQAGAQAAQVQELQQVYEQRRARQGIIQRYPASPNETPQQTGARLLRMLPEFVQAGDMEMVGRLTELLKSMGFGGDVPQGTPHSGINPATGKPEQYLVDRNGNIRWLGVAPTERSGQQQLQDQRAFAREQQLADDYRQDVKPWLVPYQALNRALTNQEQAQAGNAPAQVQMLYAFISTLDNSVVREGEQALFLRAAPVVEQARAFLAKWAQNRGAAMPPGLVEQVGAILNEVEGAFADRFEAYRTYYTERARRWGVDPQSFMNIPETFRGKVKKPTGAGARGDALLQQIPQVPDASSQRPRP
jgi:hypothetical protein